MDLVGAWLRQLLKAGTAAALVPTAMIAALVVVLIGAGGFGGLGSLSQLVTGPQVSPAERLASAGPGDGGDVAPVAPADAQPSPGSSAPAGARAGPRPPATAPRRRWPAIDPQDPARVRGPPRLVLPAPAPPPPPPATAARPPTLKERTQVLGGKLKETVGNVGTAVQEIVEEVGKTLGRIVNPQ